MQLTDTHTHLYSHKFESDRTDMVQRAIDAGVTRMFLPNIDATSINGMLALAGEFPQNCFPMMGVHPCSVQDNWEEELETARQWLFDKAEETPHKKWYGVGEIGLDYYWDKSRTEQQKTAFRQQINWGKELNLPVIIHCRESMHDILDILEEEHDDRLTGVLHCFTGTAEDAQRAIKLGFYLGIGGVITFKNSGLDAVVKDIPLQHLLLETDAPYLAPVPHRGKRNESAYVTLVADKVAECTGHTVAEVAQQTTHNALKLFQMQ